MTQQNRQRHTREAMEIEFRLVGIGRPVVNVKLIVGVAGVLAFCRLVRINT